MNTTSATAAPSLAQVMAEAARTNSDLALRKAAVNLQSSAMTKQGDLALQVIMAAMTGKGINLDTKA